MTFPVGEYEVVLADPPWPYYGSQDKWAAAAKFYTMMTDQEILDLPMRSIMAKDSVLFLWATSPRLDFAVEAIRAWGLNYRGVAFVWVKTRADGQPLGATGVRPSIVKPLTEFVLAASPSKKGRPLPLSSESIRQTIFSPKREHSRKPDEVHQNIERMYPKASKIELFARRPYPGWDVWGDEISDGVAIATQP